MNIPTENWPDFINHYRLQPLAQMAFDQHLLSPADLTAIDRLVQQLPRIFPEEPPALIHGDLWSGNFMTDSKGEAVMYDPAVYYGHREMDLGMTRLFGGFDAEFYDAYNETYPLVSGWEQRLEIANLYPLLVHVNLFGMGYVGSVRQVLKDFN